MFSIEIYEAKDLKRRFRIGLVNVLRPSAEAILDRPLEDASFTLELQRVGLNPRLRGEPTLDNLIPELGYGTLKVHRNGLLIYQHPHTVEELIAMPLQKRLRERDPSIDHWGFRLVGPGLPESIMRPAPLVEGEILVGAEPDHALPLFDISPIEEPPPDSLSLAGLGLPVSASQSEAFVKVLVHESVHDELDRSRHFSGEVEEGGFLIGRTFRDDAHDGTFVLEVTGALSAEQTGASLLHFTFSGDSFSNVKRTLRRHRPDDRLIGWYHTHLFAATDDFGLSTIDFELHFTTFTLPWQVAGLINLEDRGRTLRFYVRKGDDMALCPYWVVTPEDSAP